MTEDEAKTKWCPMVRQPIEAGEYTGSFNRGDAPDYANIDGSAKFTCNCIASDCAMWVWYEWKLDNYQRVTNIGVSGRCGLKNG